jgi:hypothetical protein
LKKKQAYTQAYKKSGVRLHTHSFMKAEKKIIKSFKISVSQNQKLETIRNKNRKFNLSAEVGKLIDNYEESK